MITDHTFRNQCMVIPGACRRCDNDPENKCSFMDAEFRTCFKTRAEHAESLKGEKTN